jgi:hypothetical protein
VAAYEPLLMWGAPDDAAIRYTFTTMQQMIRGGHMGEAIMFSIHESVDREVRRGHMPSWVVPPYRRSHRVLASRSR